MERYAAQLLFQFRVTIDGDPGKRRVCEERIITIRAKDPREALRLAKRHGRRAEHSYLNSDTNRVAFEFIGVMELLSLSPQCGEDEVWYDIVERILPSERRTKFIPNESELNAMQDMKRKRVQGARAVGQRGK